MKKSLNLDRVNVQFIPPKAVGLLAKYRSHLKKHNGTVIKLSSKNLLNDLKQSHKNVNNKELDDLYEKILVEVGATKESKKKINLKDIKAFRSLGFS